MRSTLILPLLFAISSLFGQNKIQWSEDYKLKLSDFQSPSSQIGEIDMYSIRTGSSFDFEFSMSGYEFMFTKNFNDKVDSYFSRNAAILVAPDSSFANDLLSFAQYEFDLSELYARKLRKKLYENKGAFSSYDFFREYFEEVQNEYVQRYTQTGKETDLGRDKGKLTELHNKVMEEIHELSEYCKTCKPAKKKRKKENK
ncbi:MAG: hypothetical protein C0595_14465 [Marinilabiliales bacterium]|nr:MAG: hypothetical protein C0595_14465 [Marinilabiliales bacterium]